MDDREILGKSAALRRVAALIVLLSALASGCGSEGPPEQTKQQSPTLTGTATYGAQVEPGDVTVRGIAGRQRTGSNSSGTNQFSVSLEQLSAPYALKYQSGDGRGGIALLYGFATEAGVANVTPLTTLLVAQLFGQDPELAYAGFNASGTTNTRLVTDANIREAQGKLVRYLQDVLGIPVRAPTASFVTSTFSAAAGDPMFDTMKALDDKLAETGRSLDQLALDVGRLARLCIEENISVSVGGEQREFCPAAKAANPDETDNAVLNYIFSAATTNDVLTVKIRENEVLSAELVTAAGAHYTCSGAACGAIALGTPANDFTRSLSFSNAPLTGEGGLGVTLNGTLLGAIPGVALPILPCDDNRFFLIKQDRSVVADCVDLSDPFGVGGTFYAQMRGASPSRADYFFGNSGSSHPGMPGIWVTTDANDALVSVFYRELDPDTFSPTVQLVCEAAACNGVTLGPVTVNTEFDPSLPLFIRTISLDDTVLAGLNDAGDPTGETVTLKASFTTIYLENPAGPTHYPDLAECLPGSDTIAITADATDFNFCSAPSGRVVFAGPEEGTFSFVLNEETMFTPITVSVANGVVTQVQYSSSVSQNFYCSNDCEGITVSPPDADGNRTLSFENAVLSERQNFPRPGPRKLVLNGAQLVFAP